jgi:hypothetical protein
MQGFGSVECVRASLRAALHFVGLERWWPKGLAAAVMLAVGLLLAPGSSHAATINVNTTNTAIVFDGACGLREAVIAVNNQAAFAGCGGGNGSNDRIVVPAGTYQTSVTMEVLRSVEIAGAGMGSTFVETGAPFGFVVRAADSGPGLNPVLRLVTLTLRKLAAQTLPVTGAFADGGLEDRALLVLDDVWLGGFNSNGVLLSGDDPVMGTAELNAFDTTIADNSGAGIRGTAAQIEIDHSSVLGNDGSGIVALNGTSVVALYSTIDGNSSPLDGGGINFFGGAGLFVQHSVISNNIAGRNGGGIFWGGTFGTNIDHVTISGNRAQRGGGIYSQSQPVGYFQPHFVTIAFNDAQLQGGGVFVDPSLFGGARGITQSIVARNTLAGNPAASANGTDIFGEVLNVDGCLLGTVDGMDDNCGCVAGGICANLPPELQEPGQCTPNIAPGPGGILDPLIGPLGNFGGPTRVHPLLPGSPAIDNGTETSFIPLDQRGLPRPVDGDGVGGARTDLGAFELQCAPQQQQLVSNQGFEVNTSGWVGSFGTTITSSTAQAHSGARSLRVENRNLGTWQGAIYNLLGLAQPGESLQASGWVRIVGDPSEPALLTRRAVCAGGSPIYQTVASGTATNTGWLQLSGTATVPNCTLTELTVYFEGPRTTVIMHIDDVSVVRQGLVCEDVQPDLSGTFLVTTDWGSGYCVELRITNPNTVPTTNWSASFNLNGTSIYTIWNLGSTGSTGPITVTPTADWSRVIPAGGTSHSLGFCANRPGGGSALPSTPVVVGSF